MEFRWTEERIREEIARLDALTGLNGRALPILFSRAKRALGEFAHNGKQPVRFRFSRLRFEEPDFPDESAKDVIRHEYAHYMDFVRNGSTSHGPRWKACCREIGTPPERLFNKERCQQFREKEAEAQALQQVREQFTAEYRPGDVIFHPRFGDGTIELITNEGSSSKVLIAFPSGPRVFSLSWIARNCPRRKHA